MKTNRENKRKFVRRIATFFLIIALPLIIYGLIGSIKITKIECRSQFGPCRMEVNEKLSQYSDKGITYVINSVKSDLNDDLFIEKYYYRYYFPNTLRVDTIERKAHYAIKNQDNNLILVGGAGMVLANTTETVLPTLFVDGNPPQIGEKADPEMLFQLNILYDVANIFQVKNGLSENNTLTVGIENYSFIFPSRGERDVLMGSMIFIFDKLRNGEVEGLEQNNGKTIQIDLRFQNPVISVL